MAGREPNQQLLKKEHPVWTPPRTVPAQSQPQGKGVKTITMSDESSRAALWIIFWMKGCCLGVQHIMGCRGKAVWDCTGFITGYLGEKQNVGQGRGLGVVGEEQDWANGGVR